MDADIAAADALVLERIKAQDYRNELADLAAHRAAMREHQSAFAAWFKSAYAALPDPQAELRREMALAIADKYFTTSTATLDASIQTDAVNDARRFRAALDEAVKVVGE